MICNQTPSRHFKLNSRRSQYFHCNPPACSTAAGSPNVLCQRTAKSIQDAQTCLQKAKKARELCGKSVESGFGRMWIMRCCVASDSKKKKKSFISSELLPAYFTFISGCCCSFRCHFGGNIHLSYSSFSLCNKTERELFSCDTLNAPVLLK